MAEKGLVVVEDLLLPNEKADVLLDILALSRPVKATHLSRANFSQIGKDSFRRAIVNFLPRYKPAM